jgi:hypothetical protein
MIRSGFTPPPPRRTPNGKFRFFVWGARSQAQVKSEIPMRLKGQGYRESRTLQLCAYKSTIRKIRYQNGGKSSQDVTGLLRADGVAQHHAPRGPHRRLPIYSSSSYTQPPRLRAAYPPFTSVSATPLLKPKSKVARNARLGPTSVRKGGRPIERALWSPFR